jgi:hypothetical protein
MAYTYKFQLFFSFVSLEIYAQSQTVQKPAESLQKIYYNISKKKLRYIDAFVHNFNLEK